MLQCIKKQLEMAVPVDEDTFKEININKKKLNQPLWPRSVIGKKRIFAAVQEKLDKPLPPRVPRKIEVISFFEDELAKMKTKYIFEEPKTGSMPLLTLIEDKNG